MVSRDGTGFHVVVGPKILFWWDDQGRWGLNKIVDDLKRKCFKMKVTCPSPLTQPMNAENARLPNLSQDNPLMSPQYIFDCLQFPGIEISEKKTQLLLVLLSVRAQMSHTIYYLMIQSRGECFSYHTREGERGLSIWHSAMGYVYWCDYKWKGYWSNNETVIYLLHSETIVLCEKRDDG